MSGVYSSDVFVILKLYIASVAHATEVYFVYGAPPDTNSTSATTLSAVMMDYWISFATSLDPNDGRGIQRTFSVCSLLANTNDKLDCRSALE